MSGLVLLVSFAGALACGFMLQRYEKVGWLALIVMFGSAITSLFVPEIQGVKTFDIFALSLVFGFGMSIAERRAKSKKAKADFEALKTSRPQYKHCPHCRSPLAEREIDEKKRLACTHCQFVYWNNPLPVAAAVIPHA
ncbi:MAG: zinc ribbon domain-containing protein, partial [Candidatus Melainabacteria bacterium]|nr:zinc ribbon domain-containing protein [Candidatus Melainabacteria bacterium]